MFYDSSYGKKIILKKYLFQKISSVKAIMDPIDPKPCKHFLRSFKRFSMFQPECVRFCLGMHEGYLRLDPVHVKLVPKSVSLFYPSFSAPLRLSHPTSAFVLATHIVFDGFRVLVLSSLVPVERLNSDGKYFMALKKLN